MSIRIPTSLSEKKIYEFIGMYYWKYGEVLQPQDAEERALRTMRFLAIVIDNHPKFRADSDSPVQPS